MTSHTLGTPATRPAVAARGVRGTGVGGAAVRLHTTGELGRWQQLNREATVPHAVTQLHLAGNLDNFRRLPDGDEQGYRGRYPFLDTDLYKTLEGVAVVLAEAPTPELEAFWEESLAAVAGAQRPDGYLSTWFQAPDVAAEPWSDLSWGHELYNLGHLVQAAVVAHRRLGEDRLLAVARRFADLAVRRYGPGGEEAYCGHPEVEMALVELYRETGAQEYLELARLFVERRGQGRLTHKIFSAEYFQDAVPLRELDSVTGHAVRMVYLAAGATDVALETDDASLLAVVERLWDDMVASKLYLTGGLGSRHSDEAIGDRFELPSERGYNETCAAIGTMQWGWRLFLATGRADVLDVVERVLYNAYAVGTSADGTAFFYDNPLQRRPDHVQRSGAEIGGELLRRPWFGCPCCPPNVVRWNAELGDHVALVDEDSLTLALLTSASLDTAVLDLDVRTDYPWEADVTISVRRAVERPVALVLRVPSWTRLSEVRVDGTAVGATAQDGWLRLERVWQPGEVLEVVLEQPTRLVRADPRVDAVRGSRAVVRGAVVHCVEQVDSDVDVEDLVLLPGTAAQIRPAPGPGHALTVPVSVRRTTPARLYRDDDEPTDPVHPHPGVTFVPYATWGNREPGAMRVWLPDA